MTMNGAAQQQKAFAVCVNNEGYEASLEQRKIYQLAELAETERGHDLIRVIDESGEDYLYPRRMFVEVQLPPEAERAFDSVA